MTVDTNNVQAIRMSIINGHAFNILWLAVVVYASTVVSAVSAEKFIVVSPHPIDAALSILQRRLGCMITFEDSPYENLGRMEKENPRGIAYPRELEFIFDYQRCDDPLTVLQNMITRYQEIDDNTIYTVTKSVTDEKAFHIYPKKCKDVKGNYQDYSSLSDRRISYIIQEGESWRDGFQQFCSQLSRPGLTYDYTGPFQNGEFRHLEFVETSPLDCLSHMIDQVRPFNDSQIITWSVRRGPSMPDIGELAVLYIYSVQPEAKINEKVIISIESERPLMTAMSYIEMKQKCSLIYEDPIYACPCDVMRDAHGQAYRPAGGALVCEINSNFDDRDAIMALVQAYNTQNHTAQYAIGMIARDIYVYPVFARDENGEFKPYDALLRKKVMPLDIELSLTDNLKKTIAEISGGRSVQIECDRIKDVKMATTSQESNGMLANILSDISAMMDCPIFWQLQYMPEGNSYDLVPR